jgi:tRNA uridine 5-carboxymethylaminomethyl modification enzyme
MEMQTLLSTVPHLQIVEASVEDLILDEHDRTVRGILTSDGQTISAPKVVITTGTFLRGKIYLGQESFAAGRCPPFPSLFSQRPVARKMRDSDDLEPPSIGLARTLERSLSLFQTCP